MMRDPTATEPTLPTTGQTPPGGPPQAPTQDPASTALRDHQQAPATGVPTSLDSNPAPAANAAQQAPATGVPAATTAPSGRQQASAPTFSTQVTQTLAGPRRAEGSRSKAASTAGSTEPSEQPPLAANIAPAPPRRKVTVTTTVTRVRSDTTKGEVPRVPHSGPSSSMAAAQQPRNEAPRTATARSPAATAPTPSCPCPRPHAGHGDGGTTRRGSTGVLQQHHGVHATGYQATTANGQLSGAWTQSVLTTTPGAPARHSEQRANTGQGHGGALRMLGTVIKHRGHTAGEQLQATTTRNQQQQRQQPQQHQQQRFLKQQPQQQRGPLEQ